ncbi:biliverdin-producing heme oxygenase [Legionella impletisoli]|uniref:Heme oxygenase n=1 Tax=Legionella impletisoli TaxID=343510 RepID=A0A917NAJ2_9GAMM|nr:biliverdin-producing heme oxygenase [Legionella impletisoli]GGI83273.1 hypothetical protein GCM10007966_09790 [Legionella impletisoli]
MSSESLPLSSYLKDQTAMLHLQVEQHPWVIQLLNGRLSISNYGLLLYLLLEVYETFESNLSYGSKHVLYREELLRTEKIKQDLKILSDLIDFNSLKNSILVNPYAIYLKNETQLETWVGHFYTRYFGDIQGGQIIKRNLKINYNLPEEALTFYDFSAFKKRYPEGIHYLRAMINEIPFSTQQKTSVLSESKKSFLLSSQLMDLCLSYGTS